jgi:acetylornithine deacetylase
MGRVLAMLDKLAKELPGGEAHPLVGPPSLLVPLVKGGTHQFIYPDRCTISVERRTIPGEQHQEIAQQLENLLDVLRTEDEKFIASLKTGMERNSYEISEDAEIVKTLSGAVSKVLGRAPGYVGHDWWEDSALLAEAGIETVIIGPKGSGIHTHEEWVDIQSVVDLAGILAQTAISYCN